MDSLLYLLFLLWISTVTVNILAEWATGRKTKEYIREIKDEIYKK